MVNGQQMGPFTSEEIELKGFSTDSYVYNKDLGGWKLISEIPGFFSENTIQPGYHPPAPPQPVKPDIGNPETPLGDQTSTNYISYASWGSRLGAYLLDVVFLVIFFVIIFGVTGAIFGADEETMLIAYIPYLIGVLIYYAVLESGSSQGTWGKQIVGLKVIDSTTQLPVSFGQASGRFISRIILSFIPIVGLIDYLNPLWSNKKQTWHDQMSSCIVIDK